MCEALRYLPYLLIGVAEYKYNTFLDSYSIEKGLGFQEELQEFVVDSDVMVFILESWMIDMYSYISMLAIGLAGRMDCCWDTCVLFGLFPRQSCSLKLKICF